MIARILIYIKRIQCLNVLSCELPLSYMYVCLFVCQTRALLQNRFDICSLYMRSSSATSAETSAAGVRTDDISVMCRLRTRSACAARRISAVQTIVSDFEAALWLAVRDVFPGIAQRGFAFHFSQAVWRNVQSVGLQLAYAKDDSINRVCHKTQAQALCFLPADAIGDEFGKLEQVAAAGDDTRVQGLYVRRTWVDGCWRPATWSVFRQPVRTNNDVEGWHHRLNAKASHGRMNLYQLQLLIHDEARLVTLAVRLLSECGTSRMQRSPTRSCTATSSSCGTSYPGGKPPFLGKQTWFAVNGCYIWLDSLDLLQQRLGGQPFEYATVTLKFKMASKMAAIF